MDDELFKIRKLFIESVSLPMIKDLLDDLEEDKVLTAAESASVTEDNTSRADRARSLVDMVKRKGNKASEKMIAHLRTSDPELFSKLGMVVPPPAPPPAQPPAQPSATSSGLILCTDGFVKEKQKSINDIYPVIHQSIRTRLALIITNIEFDDVKMNRRGAEKDEENMEKLLIELGYNVVKHRNLSAQDIDREVKNFSQHPDLSQTDSVFVVLMSHGKLGFILGVPERDPEGSFWSHVLRWLSKWSPFSRNRSRDEFPIDNIFKHLNSQNCPALRNKPKVIIIQACRGGKKGLVSDGPCDAKTPAMTSDTPSQPATEEEEFEDDALHSVHMEKDFISLLSSTPEHLSYRSRENGSFLIQFINDTFKTHAHNQHVEDLFTKVMNCFEDSDKVPQMPTKDRCTLTKHFYLFPGH